MTSSWQTLTFRVPASRSDSLSAALADVGTGGLEILEETLRTHTVAAFFDATLDASTLLRRIRQSWVALGQPPAALKFRSRAQVENQDWVGRWREQYRPVPVGRDFLILPSWWNRKKIGTAASERPERLDRARWRITLDPQNAFGSGTHASTRLCLLGIAAHYRPGVQALDVGTGSGILALAMAKVNSTAHRKGIPERVITAVDCDPDAVHTARRNAVRNQVGKWIRFRRTGLEELRTVSFGFVVANLTALDLQQSAGQLSALCARGGLLLLAGLQNTDAAHLRSLYRRQGFRHVQTRRQEGWSLLVMRKK